ncbi:MAG: type II toxin-antitoxin system prevent-host-death family antitoxin, partial [Thermodesulfobacteriota bacterium]|nr:type II toxin-antitoxin system prevent-host-death family antitoxin [Thermodesulfobacteriota bacterium]
MTNIVTYNKTMINLNINEIKTHFSSYLAKVSNGETVIVSKRNVPIAEIKPIVALPNKKRPIGLAGKEYPEFQISDAFFEPLPDDIVAAFNGYSATLNHTTCAKINQAVDSHEDQKQYPIERNLSRLALINNTP